MLSSRENSIKKSSALFCPLCACAYISKVLHLVETTRNVLELGSSYGRFCLQVVYTVRRSLLVTTSFFVVEIHTEPGTKTADDGDIKRI